MHNRIAVSFDFSKRIEGIAPKSKKMTINLDHV
jgi:hypothetical protein